MNLLANAMDFFHDCLERSLQQTNRFSLRCGDDELPVTAHSRAPYAGFCVVEVGTANGWFAELHRSYLAKCGAASQGG